MGNALPCSWEVASAIEVLSSVGGSVPGHCTKEFNMSKRRNSGLMNKGLRLLVWLIFITPLGLVLSLASPLATGSVGVGCVKALSPSAQDNASDWAGEEFVVVGWPINWLELTRHKDCWQPPSGLTGFTIDWVFLALNEGILLVG